MPFFRVERTVAPVVFFVEADDKETAVNILSDINQDPHIAGQIADWQIENTTQVIDDEPYDGFNEDEDWCVFWDEKDQRYYWQ